MGEKKKESMQMMTREEINPPAEATSSIGKSRVWAMYPSTENTATPAKILVALLRQHSARQSLQHSQNKIGKKKKEKEQMK